MAVDAAEKRFSATMLLVPSFTPGVVPSSVDAAERQAATWVYSGITAAVVADGVFVPYKTLLHRRRRGG